jgi:hypothetical protein
VAPDDSTVFVLPALDRNVDRTRKADAEVDAALPLAVAALSGDRKPEWETWVRTRPRGGEVGVVVVADEATKEDDDEYTDSQPGSS